MLAFSKVTLQLSGAVSRVWDVGRGYFGQLTLGGI